MFAAEKEGARRAIGVVGGGGIEGVNSRTKNHSQKLEARMGPRLVGIDYRPQGAAEERWTRLASMTSRKYRKLMTPKMLLASQCPQIMQT